MAVPKVYSPSPQRSFTLMVLPTFPPPEVPKSVQLLSLLQSEVFVHCFETHPASVRNIKTTPGICKAEAYSEVAHLSRATENVISLSERSNRWLTFTTLRDTTCLLSESIAFLFSSTCFISSCNFAPSSPGNAVELVCPRARSEPIEVSCLPLQR